MSVSKRLRYEILRRDNHACRYCGASAPDVPITVDHVVPEALGGSDDPSNLVAACKDCNAGKSATSPDATMVAQVADDALRWARAQSLAAQRMLANLERRDADRRQFESTWNRWQDSSGRTVPLPVDWPDSVDRFTGAGLPVPLLLDCVDKAMRNKKVRHDGKFRYACGIAWKLVSELNEASSTELRGTSSSEVHAGSRVHEEVLEHLSGHLPDIDRFSEQAYVDRLASEFDDYHEDDEYDDGSPVDHSAWGPHLKAMVRSFEQALDIGDEWSQQVFNVVSVVLGADWSAVLTRARAHFETIGISSPDWSAVVCLALEFAIADHVGLKVQQSWEARVALSAEVDD